MVTRRNPDAKFRLVTFLVRLVKVMVINGRVHPLREVISRQYAAMLKLTTGSHVIVLKFPGHADWSRTLEVLKFSKTSLKGTLDAAP